MISVVPTTGKEAGSDGGRFTRTAKGLPYIYILLYLKGRLYTLEHRKNLRLSPVGCKVLLPPLPHGLPQREVTLAPGAIPLVKRSNQDGATLLKGTTDRDSLS